MTDQGVGAPFDTIESVVSRIDIKREIDGFLDTAMGWREPCGKTSMIHEERNLVIDHEWFTPASTYT